jgi:hypothetical protein
MSRRNSRKLCIQTICLGQQIIFLHIIVAVAQHTQVTPHRHDLIPHSCVNKEVAKYNRLMKKVVKQFPNIQFLDLDLDRSHFTNHGMHLNSEGKNQTSKYLVELTDLIFDQPQPPPIPIPWELTNPGLYNQFAVWSGTVRLYLRPTSYNSAVLCY